MLLELYCIVRNADCYCYCAGAVLMSLWALVLQHKIFLNGFLGGAPGNGPLMMLLLAACCNINIPENSMI